MGQLGQPIGVYMSRIVVISGFVKGWATKTLPIHDIPRPVGASPILGLIILMFLTYSDLLPRVPERPVSLPGSLLLS